MDDLELFLDVLISHHGWLVSNAVLHISLHQRYVTYGEVKGHNCGVCSHLVNFQLEELHNQQANAQQPALSIGRKLNAHIKRK